MLATRGSSSETLTPEQVEGALAPALGSLPMEGRGVLAIIPDGTRTAPIPLLFRLLCREIATRAARLDYLIALGTHPPMSEEGIARLVGAGAAERETLCPGVRIFNHRWDLPEALATIGTLRSEEMAELTGGLMAESIPMRLNRLILDYDQLLICGPVFPHEVAGFSGGAKYLFPGIAGPEIIDATHWLGALATSMRTIGVKDTPVRRVIHRAAEMVPRPVLCLAMVLRGEVLHGIHLGSHREAFDAAADLSARLNMVTLPRAFRRVLSMPAAIYDDLWTAAKAMYKVESAVADGGEVVIYAPWITEISHTHGRLIDRVGYHVRDYFLKQPHRFGDVPGSIKAHSSHLKGAGSYDPTTGREEPRIRVTLATGIPRDRCLRVNLGYLDHREIDPRDWTGREEEGLLWVPNAGETLFRTREL